MQQISKAEMEWLIDNNYIRQEYGKYVNLNIASKRHTKKKTRYITDDLAKLVRSKKIV